MNGIHYETAPGSLGRPKRIVLCDPSSSSSKNGCRSAYSTLARDPFIECGPISQFSGEFLSGGHTAAMITDLVSKLVESIDDIPSRLADQTSDTSYSSVNYSCSTPNAHAAPGYERSLMMKVRSTESPILQHCQPQVNVPVTSWNSTVSPMPQVKPTFMLHHPSSVRVQHITPQPHFYSPTYHVPVSHYMPTEACINMNHQQMSPTPNYILLPVQHSVQPYNNIRLRTNDVSSVNTFVSREVDRQKIFENVVLVRKLLTEELQAIEVELLLGYGKLLSNLPNSLNSANAPKCPSSATKEDKELSSIVVEFSHAQSLVQRMEKLRNAVLPASIHSALDCWGEGVRKCQARRKEEVVNVANRGGSAGTRGKGLEDRDSRAVSAAAEELINHLRRARTALWAAFQMSRKNGLSEVEAMSVLNGHVANMQANQAFNPFI